MSRRRRRPDAPEPAVLASVAVNEAWAHLGRVRRAGATHVEGELTYGPDGPVLTLRAKLPGTIHPIVLSDALLDSEPDGE